VRSSWHCISRRDCRRIPPISLRETTSLCKGGFGAVRFNASPLGKGEVAFAKQMTVGMGRICIACSCRDYRHPHIPSVALESDSSCCGARRQLRFARCLPTAATPFCSLTLPQAALANVPPYLQGEPLRCSAVRKWPPCKGGWHFALQNDWGILAVRLRRQYHSCCSCRRIPPSRLRRATSLKVNWPQAKRGRSGPFQGRLWCGAL